MKDDAFEKLFGAMAFLGAAKPTSIVLIGSHPGDGKSHAILEMERLLPDGAQLIFAAHEASATRR